MSDAIKILAREIISRGFGVLQKVTVRRRKFDATSQEISREVYDSGDGAAILLYDPDRRCVLLVRQFRLAAWLSSGRESLIEVCAGKLEGLDPARRIVMEVEEETGFGIKEPRFLFEAFMSPGVFSERLSFFVAPYSPADKTGGGGGLADDNEDIQILEPTLDEALEMIARGEIVDAKTILLLNYARLTQLL
ncbi:MAG: GDP-mannose pyrophosphatase [Beijerinckiaceae bacterium]|nr:MAG: GDP-mannose pyrophosphatase [Beijerinckiaceae bacterium]